MCGCAHVCMRGVCHVRMRMHTIMHGLAVLLRNSCNGLGCRWCMLSPAYWFPYHPASKVDLWQISFWVGGGGLGECDYVAHW